MFDVHDLETAPQRSQRTLRKAEQAFGFVPNLLGVMAEAPAALEGYMGVSAAFQSSSFDAAEQQVVLLSVSFENGCGYCMAAHSTIADAEGVAAEVVHALRVGAPLPNPRLEALRVFATAVVQARGWVDAAAVDAFLAAGYTRAQVLEVVLGITQKTLSNYTNHLTATPLDPAFEAAAWTRPAVAATPSTERRAS